ncbi:MAG TPA: hypothetical protein DHW02_10285, partial [Ktedonobacter sp.]|nr:hypothetical protein [Ktedonobacter sp.]
HARNRYKQYTGLLLPQPTVITGEGQKLLLDEVLGDGFTLITYCATVQESSQLHTLMHDDAWFGVRAVGLHTSKPQSDVLTDADETHIRHVYLTEDMPEQPFPLLLRHPRLCLLVRPDRHIFGLFDIGNASNVVITLKKMLNDRSEIGYFVDPRFIDGVGP